MSERDSNPEHKTTKRSIPPFGPHGISWKTTGVIIGFIVSAFIPTATILVKIGQIQSRLEAIPQIAEQVEHNREELAVTKVRMTRAEEDIRDLKRAR